jgi:hypothetical protein
MRFLFTKRLRPITSLVLTISGLAALQPGQDHPVTAEGGTS